MNVVRNISRQDADVYMYASRLLYQQIPYDGIESRSLFLTLDVADLRYSGTMKPKVYEKMNQVLADFGVEKNYENFSMVIAGDVENTSRGILDYRIMNDPKKPHYHAIFCFRPEVWKVVDENFDDIRFVFATYLSELREVNFAARDVGKDDLPKEFYLVRYAEKKWNNRKYNFPMGDGVSYVIKADVLMSRHNIDDYQPSVYPFDLVQNPVDTALANGLCVELMDSDRHAKSIFISNIKKGISR